eukprot:8007918-Pyramimonas_sp.AAC.1
MASGIAGCTPRDPVLWVGHCGLPSVVVVKGIRAMGTLSFGILPRVSSGCACDVCHRCPRSARGARVPYSPTAL